jgi:hypothetical protein
MVMFSVFTVQYCGTVSQLFNDVTYATATHEDGSIELKLFFSSSINSAIKK